MEGENNMDPKLPGRISSEISEIKNLPKLPLTQNSPGVTSDALLD